MANPFLGEAYPHEIPSNYQDDAYWQGGCAYHVAGIMLVALIILTAMKMSGFRAMVGIGRG